jgi:hypothetical protein
VPGLAFHSLGFSNGQAFRSSRRFEMRMSWATLAFSVLRLQGSDRMSATRHEEKMR